MDLEKIKEQIISAVNNENKQKESFDINYFIGAFDALNHLSDLIIDQCDKEEKKWYGFLLPLSKAYNQKLKTVILIQDIIGNIIETIKNNRQQSNH